MTREAATDADELHRLGVQAGRQGRFEIALDLLTRATRLAPGHAAAHCDRARALKSLGRVEAALAGYDQAIAADPGHVDAYFHRGVLFGDLQRWNEALASYDRAVDLRGNHAAALCNRGVACERLGRWQDALANYDRSIEADPGLAVAHSNRGNVLKELRHLEAAVASCDRAIALQPGLADAHFNRAVALASLRLLDAAVASYDKAIELDAGHIGARFGRATASLLLGRYATGLAEYEWRWPYLCARFGRAASPFPQPPWLGEGSLRGRTILLHAEQGLGDTLQFCRYVKRVSDLGATVILRVQPRLLRTLAGLAGVSQLLAEEAPLPPFDRHCPLLSLPLALKTTVNSIPADVPYLTADPVKVAAWLARFGASRRMRVGVAWRGNPQHPDDRNRSVSADQLVTHLPPGADYVSLQLGLDDVEREALCGDPTVLDVEGAQSDFSDTAALCTALDLIVSVDTSVAHLAGALGRPTWILLPYLPDWRWGLDGARTPWYPSARLYRQETAGEWAGPLRRLAADLSALAAPRNVSGGGGGG